MEHSKTRLEIFSKILQQSPTEAGVEGLCLQGIAELVVRGNDVIQECLTEFHTKFNQVYDGPPRPLPPELKYRITFIHEELVKEYNEAVKTGNIIHQYDALLDTIYVVAGTLYLQGLPIMPGFLEVHKSNMTKELGPVGKGKHGTQVIKTDTFIRPALRQIIERAGKQFIPPPEEPVQPEINIPT